MVSDYMRLKMWCLKTWCLETENVVSEYMRLKMWCLKTWCLETEIVVSKYMRLKTHVIDPSEIREHTKFENSSPQEKATSPMALVERHTGYTPGIQSMRGFIVFVCSIDVCV